jgi:hypothetical protein
MVSGPINFLLTRDHRLDDIRKLCERLLPSEIAHLKRNGLGEPFLHDNELRSARHLRQGRRRLHFPGQVRIVELVRIADFFECYELEILAAE